MSDSYAASGVDYGPLDAFKRHCQKQAQATNAMLDARSGFRASVETRGDSAFLLETADAYFAHVEEGLGTKVLVADEMLRLTGRSHYHAIGIDTVAMITNDIVTCGARPLSVAMHAAVGTSNWFAHTQRAEDLARGFSDGCLQSRAVWGGGETPALAGVVCPETILLGGSCFGVITPKSRRILNIPAPGDDIILLASSGIHANGLSLCRTLAAKHPEGYLAKLSDGRLYGEALLEPTVIYVPFVLECLEQSIVPTSAINITGHGWRKLMRSDATLLYRVRDVGVCPPLFKFLLDTAGMSQQEGYATFNMGAGFAVTVAPRHTDQCLAIAKATGLTAWLAGTVEESPEKRVVIEPLAIEFGRDDLSVRA